MSDAPISKLFASSRLQLHYLDWGNDGAPTLILLHGGRDHAHSWDFVAGELRGDYHVVAPDLRGHGDSAWSPDGAYMNPYLVADLATLIEELGPSKVSIAAHSMGAAVSLRYAGLFPERVHRLAAIEGIGLGGWTNEPPAPVTERLRTFVEERLKAPYRPSRAYATLEEAKLRMQAANKHLSPAMVDHLTRHGTRHDADGYRWKFDGMTRPLYPNDLPDEDLRALWRRIECPVWLVHGADSWATHPDDHGRSAEFRDVRVTSYAGAGHWVHHDRFDDFVAELRGFLA